MRVSRLLEKMGLDTRPADEDSVVEKPGHSGKTERWMI